MSPLSQAEPLTLGVVLDQDEFIADNKTNQRDRPFSREVGRAVGQPVRLQYYRRGFSAIEDPKEGTLNLVFGPATRLGLNQPLPACAPIRHLLLKTRADGEGLG